jgi:hypothetical protein
MSPISISPVLKGEIVFTMMAGFPHTLDKADFSVNLTSMSAPEYMKRLNVIKVDTAASTITVKYGGAISGDYSVVMRHAQFGLIDTDALILKVES